ncbi:MAG: disulfide bond formation protein B [Rhizobiaceae bacterium]
MSIETGLGPRSKFESLQFMIAALVLVSMVGIIAIVLGFQHIGGYIPCALCLEQRIPYYVGIPAVFLALISAWQQWPVQFTRGLLAIGFITLCVTAIQGSYHSGVEWGWWQGPTECSAAVGGTSSTTDLLADLASTKAPSCNDAAGRFLGLSFAGWNVVAALGLAAIAFKGAFGRNNA